MSPRTDKLGLQLRKPIQVLLRFPSVPHWECFNERHLQGWMSSYISYLSFKYLWSCCSITVSLFLFIREKVTAHKELKNKDLKLPGQTRFGTNFTMLKRANELKHPILMFIIPALSACHTRTGFEWKICNYFAKPAGTSVQNHKFSWELWTIAI